MLILALDTCSPAGSVAVLRNEKVIGVVSTLVDETYSSRMFRHVEFILRELSVGLDEIDLFAVAAGPGSFTGLRVGLAAVKGWAEVYAKPVAAVSALEAVAIQAHSRASFLAPVLDARRGQVYYAFYRSSPGSGYRGLTPAGEACVATPAEFVAALLSRGGAEVAVVATVPELVSNVLSWTEAGNSHGQEPVMEQVSTVLAPAIGYLGYLQSRRGELVDALTLNANYVRRSDAELHWKQ